MTSSTATGLTMRRGVQSLVARHAIGFAVNFLGTLLLARTLGPHLWGVYSIAFVFQIMVQGLLERGMVGYLVRTYEPTERRRLGTALLVQVASGLLLGGAIIGIAGPLVTYFDEDALRALLVAVGISVPAYAVRAVPLGLLERRVRYERVAVVEVLDIAVFNAVALMGVLGGLGLMGLALATVVRAVTSTLAASLLAGVRLGLSASLPVVREIASFGLPYTGSNLLGYLNGAAAPLIVGGLVSTREFGVLQLAYGLIAYPQVLSTIFGRASFPVYARMTTDRDALGRSVSQATSRLIRYVGGATLVLAATSPAWVRPLFGAEWAGMSAVMLAIAPAFGIGAALTLITSSLNAVGRTPTVFLVNLTFSAVYWALALLLVPNRGALGLPMAYAAASASFLWYLKTHREAVGPLAIGSALRDFFLGSLFLLGVALVEASRED